MFSTSRTNIVEHIGHIYDENELDAESTCRKFRQVQIEGSRSFSVNQRLVSHENRLENLDSRVIYLEKQVDFFVKTNLPPSEGLLPAHAQWSGYEFAVQLVRSAKKDLVIIDPYANDMVLSLMAKRAEGVNATIYSARITHAMREEEARLNRQFPTVHLENMREVHDRFVIVDDVVYHVGASFKDLGNQMTAFSVLNFVTKEQVLAMVKRTQSS
ncbi:hypothetical protein SAMN05720470_12025 [Fibrobacter sp. UWOV1]|nr:hypothetical protein SAMN05720470_12025 [Fibrobacter sp. UWOV1]